MTTARTSGPAVDHGGLEVLSLERCLELLHSVAVGRIAFLSAGGPVILPVNHAVEGRTVVFRTAVGSKLDAAVRAAVVAFEADDYDPAGRTGWSVLVRGVADVVLDRHEIERLEDLGLEAWADGIARDHWIRVRPDEISGRRIVR